MNPADPLYSQTLPGIAHVAMSGDSTGLHPELSVWVFLSLTTGVTTAERLPPGVTMAKRLPLVLNIKVSLVDKQAPLACAGVTLPCEGHFKVPQLDSFFFTALSQLLHGIQEEPRLI